LIGGIIVSWRNGHANRSITKGKSGDTSPLRVLRLGTISIAMLHVVQISGHDLGMPCGFSKTIGRYDWGFALQLVDMLAVSDDDWSIQLELSKPIGSYFAGLLY